MNLREAYRMHREADYSRAWSAVAAFTTADVDDDLPPLRETDRRAERIAQKITLRNVWHVVQFVIVVAIVLIISALAKIGLVDIEELIDEDTDNTE